MTDTATHNDELRRGAERICASIQTSTGIVLLAVSPGHSVGQIAGAVLMLLGAVRSLAVWMRA